MTISKKPNTESTVKDVDDILRNLAVAKDKIIRLEASIDIMESQLEELREWFVNEGYDPNDWEAILEKVEESMTEIEEEAEQFLELVNG